jgi:hypothetical protein
VKKNDGMDGTPPPRPRAVRLQTARACRKFLSRIINRVNRGEMDAGVAGRLGYLVGIVVKSIEVDDVERRLAELEKLTRGDR